MNCFEYYFADYLTPLGNLFNFAARLLQGLFSDVTSSSLLLIIIEFIMISFDVALEPSYLGEPIN